MGLDIDLSVECCVTCGRSDEPFSTNITHNLTDMAQEAGIYEMVWRPDQCDIDKACDLIDPLTKAIDLMESDPERFKAFDSPNGWGLYEHFMPWLREYLEACKKHPEAKISVSR